MRSLKNHLQKELANDDFQQAYEKELRLAKLAVQIAKRREGKGLTQGQLATRAHITQQQISKVEHAGSSGFNVNTLFRVCDALGLEVTLRPRKEDVVSLSKNRSSKTTPSKNGNSKSYRVQHSTSKKRAMPA